MIFAFFASTKFDSFCESLKFNFAISIIFLALSLTFFICEKIKFTKVAFVIFTFFLSASYFGFRNPIPKYQDFAAQEMPLKILIKNVSKTNFGAINANGEILDSPAHFKDAKDIYIFIKNPKFEIFKNDEISGEFVVRPINENEEFDEYLKDLRIFFKAYATQNIELYRRSKISEFLFKDCRNFIEKKLSIYPKNHTELEGANALKAMILGDKSLLRKKLKNELSQTGTMHIFAVSGLHIGIAAVAIFSLLGILRVPKKIQPLISLPVLLFYVGACSMPPSAMRAFIMIAFLWCAYALGRGSKSFAAICFSAFVVLIINPCNLFNAGFQLSYCVVCAIILWGSDFADFLNLKIKKWRGFELKNQNLFKRTFNTSLRYVVSVFAMSLAALFASAPITSKTFGVIAILAVPFSIIFILLATISVSLGAFSIFTPAIFAQYFNFIAAKICSFMILLTHFGAESGAVVNVKISSTSAFLIEVAIFTGLIFMSKIDGGKKFLLLPFTSAIGIILACL